jgi:hypothetical protein
MQFAILQYNSIEYTFISLRRKKRTLFFVLSLTFRTFAVEHHHDALREGWRCDIVVLLTSVCCYSELL